MDLLCTNALITLATDDLENLVSFYTKFLQQKPQSYLRSVYAEFQIASLRVGIFQPKLQKQLEFASSRNSSMSLCLEVEDLESATQSQTLSIL